MAWSAICTIMAVSVVAVAALAFKAGAAYGARRAAEVMKQKIQIYMPNSTNPHYRVTGKLHESPR